MNFHVATEVSSIVEVLAADCAGGRELAGAAVYGHVVLEVAQLGERLAALTAGIPRRRRVPPHVDGQGIATSEHLMKVHFGGWSIKALPFGNATYTLVMFLGYYVLSTP